MLVGLAPANKCVGTRSRCVMNSAEQSHSSNRTQGDPTNITRTITLTILATMWTDSVNRVGWKARLVLTQGSASHNWCPACLHRCHPPLNKCHQTAQSAFEFFDFLDFGAGWELLDVSLRLRYCFMVYMTYPANDFFLFCVSITMTIKENEAKLNIFLLSLWMDTVIAC